MRPDAQDRACVRLQALLRTRKGNGATHQAEDTTQVPPEDQEGEGAPPGIRLGLLCCNCLPLRLLQLQELGVLRLLNRMLRKFWICFNRRHVGLIEVLNVPKALSLPLITL